MLCAGSALCSLITFVLKYIYSEISKFSLRSNREIHWIYQHLVYLHLMDSSVKAGAAHLEIKIARLHFQDCVVRGRQHRLPMRCPKGPHCVLHFPQHLAGSSLCSARQTAAAVLQCQDLQGSITSNAICDARHFPTYLWDGMAVEGSFLLAKKGGMQGLFVRLTANVFPWIECIIAQRIWNIS